VPPEATDDDSDAAPIPSDSISEVTGVPQRTRSVQHQYGVLLMVAYDGRRFSGWARQTNARSVAGELDGAIAAVDPKASATRGLSRTDAGVHAREQLAGVRQQTRTLPCAGGC